MTHEGSCLLARAQAAIGGDPYLPGYYFKVYCILCGPLIQHRVGCPGRRCEAMSFWGAYGGFGALFESTIARISDIFSRKLTSVSLQHIFVPDFTRQDPGVE